eukprot:758443-Hanusia_phi.AAC.5
MHTESDSPLYKFVPPHMYPPLSSRNASEPPYPPLYPYSTIRTYPVPPVPPVPQYPPSQLGYHHVPSFPRVVGR